MVGMDNTAHMTRRTCRTCGEEFFGHTNQSYCRNPCISPTEKMLSGPRPTFQKSCFRCGAEFEGNHRQKYCTAACREARPNTHKFKLNPNFEYKDSTWSKHVHAVCGNVCAGCGKNAQEAGSLHAHHIVPRARGGKNVISNGMLLCQPCHTVRHDPSLASDDLVERIAQRVVELLAA